MSFRSILLAPLLLTNPSFTFVLPNHSRQLLPVSSSSLLAATSSDDTFNSSPLRASSSPSSTSQQPHISTDLPISKQSKPNKSACSGSSVPPLNDLIRSTEFNLEPRSSPTHIETVSIYASPGSDAYWDLQDEISQLESDLRAAESAYSEEGVRILEFMLQRARERDPEYVYQVASAKSKAAELMGRMEEAERYRVESVGARRLLPQFNLEGLWVGKYGSHGFELINVTYSGDKLIAYKVTGDRNIPRGEVTFTADLCPSCFNDYNNDGHVSLQPIVLSEASAKEWGTKRLPRYPGKGHAAEPRFISPQCMEGQLVVIGPGDYFSFAWIPLEHQIFFGRPSPELILRMLREGGGPSLTAGIGQCVPRWEDGDVNGMRDYVARCLEVTVDTFWDERAEGKMDVCSGIWHGNEEYSYFE